jgi:Na+-translocating ferredoxin:NAD+ oxidoreductase RnfG subunit
MSKITTTKIERNSAEQGVDRIKQLTAQSAGQNQFNESIRSASEYAAHLTIVKYYVEVDDNTEAGNFLENYKDELVQ